MESVTFQPWLHDVLLLAQLRRGARVLQVTGQSPEQAVAILELIGRGGSLLVLEPDRYAAERIRAVSEHAALNVISYRPEDSETFGQFDTMVASPLRLPDWPIDRWGELAMNNLRPGGRFVVDLPGESQCEALAEAWRKVGGDEDALRAWQGPSTTALASVLRGIGLRQVEGVVGTHLVRVDSPRSLADYAVDKLGGAEALRESLSLALVQRLRTTGIVELIFRRTRVHGMR